MGIEVEEEEAKEVWDRAVGAVGGREKSGEDLEGSKVKAVFVMLR